MDEEEGAYETGRQEHTLIGVIEPDELDKHDTEERKIIFNDVPERFQTRKIPVTSADDEELKAEALWIQQTAFDTLNLISRQVIRNQFYNLFLCFRKELVFRLLNKEMQVDRTWSAMRQIVFKKC